MDGLIGEIRAFAFNYFPQGWLPCNGSSYPMMTYAALYSIIGTQFGSSGSTFQVPNLVGNIVTGAQSGVPQRAPGNTGGTTAVTLTTAQLPAHNHAIKVVVRNLAAQSVTGTAAPGSTVYLTNGYSIGVNKAVIAYSAINNSPVTMNNLAITSSGSGLEHSNMAPYLAMNFCICCEGAYPIRP